MTYAVEIIVSEHPSTLPAATTTPTQRLPLIYDTVKEARAAAAEFIEQNKAPPGTVTFQIVDDSGEIVVPPSAGSPPTGPGNPPA